PNGDIDLKDTLVDIVVGCQGGYVVLYNDWAYNGPADSTRGRGKFPSMRFFGVNGQTMTIASGDVTGTGQDSVIVGTTNTATIVTYDPTSTDGKGFGEQSNVPTGSGSNSTVVGDFTNGGTDGGYVATT